MADVMSPQFTASSSGFSVQRSPVRTQAQRSTKLDKTKWPTARLPRDGPESGGGKVEVGDRSLLVAIQEQAEQDELVDSVWAEDTLRQTPKTPKSKASSRAASASVSRSRLATRDSSQSDALISTAKPADITVTVTGGGSPGAAREKPENQRPDGPEARRRVELQAKFDKAEAIRTFDQKNIREKNERFKELRDERFKRLLDHVADHGGLATEAAENIRHLENHQQERREELHTMWEESVHQTIAQQAFNHLNPPDRALHQRLWGSKSVSWQLPHQQRRLRVNHAEDPAKKPLMDNMRENAFHQAASSVLGHSHSSPDIHRRSMHLQGTPGSSSPVMAPRALSRPVFEPTEWSGPALQGSLFGRFAQVCEHGPGFKRAQRGGTNVHLPDETDGVLAAGTRRHREHGHGDKGILKGNTAANGETSDYKSHEGASSGAPAQDHFSYSSGSRVTDMEFPLGKRLFPEFH
eukprot:TRINITY_DN13375_c0_g1_i1.p1 TRINITY_DN13375_c0_g1~~TRINITY_DN13375_c0_g1_i1.p1  ORF type:complete len:466 (-),score=92.71 TRINITY_DN13375_c0_g1_i1:68-1465(-)